MGQVIEATFDATKQPASLDHLVVLGEKGQMPGKDANSASYWVPVHSAAMLMAIGKENYERSLPKRWR